jgi:SpoVK/Ycf46/Vps4 family AAA+-type ATPase
LESLDESMSRNDLQFLEAIQFGLEGEAARMQQALRRVLRRRPEMFERSPALYQALVLAATQAHPPIPVREDPVSPRELVPSANFPTRLHDRQFPSPAGGNGLPRRAGSGSALGPQLRLSSSSEPDTGRTLLDLEASLPGALQLDRGMLVEPILGESVRRELRQIIGEYDFPRGAVATQEPTKSVLLTGAPGTGKTITARWLAAAVDKPMVVLDLAYVMSHELGRSAHNMREALDWASINDVVVFVDEFDAIAGARANGNDVGEMRRLVNVLLLRLDSWPRGQLLIAATNHPELLDRAIERRFDLIIELSAPDEALRAEMLTVLLPELSHIEVGALAALTQGLSGSTIQRAVDRSRRRVAFEGRSLSLADVVETFNLSASKPPKEARDRIIHALSSTNMSARQIAEIVGVSHPTVLSVIKRRS